MRKVNYVRLISELHTKFLKSAVWIGIRGSLFLVALPKGTLERSLTLDFIQWHHMSFWIPKRVGIQTYSTHLLSNCSNICLNLLFKLPANPCHNISKNKLTESNIPCYLSFTNTHTNTHQFPAIPLCLCCHSSSTLQSLIIQDKSQCRHKRRGGAFRQFGRYEGLEQSHLKACVTS